MCVNDIGSKEIEQESINVKRDNELIEGE